MKKKNLFIGRFHKGAKFHFVMSKDQWFGKLPGSDAQGPTFATEFMINSSEVIFYALKKHDL